MPQDEGVIDGVLTRLWRYLRGSMSLIVVDSLVYIGIFWALRMPLFPVFGVLSGLSVVLPVFGLPTAGALTVLWCVVCGMVWWKILLVVAVFLLYGGVIEQFVISPVLVGGALGLTAKEALLAIIVGVLIGNIFGILLALPVAGVLKYLCLRLKKEDRGS